ncbi:MAG: 16S rRNA (uracil(1498)-N(3))-methyltransferase [Deltaproteobacteria bacterium]|nr:16S rRNA (uracil(1498)-N(3))-methyltransferase [Deltaproteobacteria bacterium]
MARFFVPRENIHESKAIVRGQELNHLRRALRQKPGDRIIFFDNEGWEHEGILRSYEHERGEIEILNSFRPGRESSLQVTLAQALGKGEKMDWVVEKSTELGVASIVPFISRHTVPRPDARKIQARLERWKRIALSATKQCGRTQVPVVLELADFHDLVSGSWDCELKLFLWEREPAHGLAQVREEKTRLKSLLLVIGPEGGFSPEEVSKALASGFASVRLGQRILRTETAALAALSIAQYLWGDMA